MINTGFNYDKLHGMNGIRNDNGWQVRHVNELNRLAWIELSLLYRRERDLHLVGVTALATLSRSMMQHK